MQKNVPRNIVFFTNPILARPSTPLILKLFIADAADFLATRSDVRFTPKSGHSASSFLAELSVEFIVQPDAQTAKSAPENALSRLGFLFACDKNVSPTSPSSRR